MARNVKVIEDAPAQATANGALHWPDYESIIRAAHNLINELEPDVFGPLGEEGSIVPIAVDRSRARVAFLSTIVIAASNGKIAVDAESDVPF